MLASGKMVGFVPTKDYDEARAFYEGKLEFEFVSLDQYALVMSVGGHRIRIAKVPNFVPSQGTVLGWEVKNIEATVTWLRDQAFLRRNIPSCKIANLEFGQHPMVTRSHGSKIRTAISFP